MKMTTFLCFEEMLGMSKKTKTWLVHSKQTRAMLGTVKWFASWRRYCFMPACQTTFDAKCLEEIEMFLNEKMAEHCADREKAKRAKF